MFEKQVGVYLRSVAEVQNRQQAEFRQLMQALNPYNAQRLWFAFWGMSS